MRPGGNASVHVGHLNPANGPILTVRCPARDTLPGRTAHTDGDRHLVRSNPDPVPDNGNHSMPAKTPAQAPAVDRCGCRSPTYRPLLCADSDR